MQTTTTNVKNRATTQLVGFDFNSYFQFGDMTAAISDEGIFELGGNALNGADIDSSLETFATKLGHDSRKRLRYIYLMVETEGTLKVTPTVDGIEQPAVTFTPAAGGRQILRMPVGRGAKGVYWSFKVENVDGCWFSIDEAQVLPQNLSL